MVRSEQKLLGLRGQETQHEILHVRLMLTHSGRQH